MCLVRSLIRYLCGPTAGLRFRRTSNRSRERDPCPCVARGLSAASQMDRRSGSYTCANGIRRDLHRHDWHEWRRQEQRSQVEGGWLPTLDDARRDKPLRVTRGSLSDRARRASCTVCGAVHGFIVERTVYAGTTVVGSLGQQLCVRARREWIVPVVFRRTGRQGGDGGRR
jgi:hypothetical protein